MILTHSTADLNPSTLRISLDAKATIKLGLLSRKGSSRVVRKALDHDYVGPDDKVFLLGFYLPDLSETYFFLLPCTKHLTSDAIVDCLQQLWAELAPRFPKIERLLLNLDNGPDCNSRRTQFVNRLVQFSDATNLTVELAYYPPYHSKYNPIERVWGVLEQHWNGFLLDSVDTVVKMAKTMTYKGTHPVVTVVESLYERGVKLTKKAMKFVEARLSRLSALPKYFVTISPSSTA